MLETFSRIFRIEMIFKVSFMSFGFLDLTFYVILDIYDIFLFVAVTFFSVYDTLQ